MKIIKNAVLMLMFISTTSQSTSLNDIKNHNLTQPEVSLYYDLFIKNKLDKNLFILNSMLVLNSKIYSLKTQVCKKAILSTKDKKETYNALCKTITEKEKEYSKFTNIFLEENVMSKIIKKQKTMEVCEFAEVSEYLMKMRQKGVDKSEVIKQLEKTGNDKLGVRLILESVYKKPIADNEQDKKYAIIKYKNQAIKHCNK